MAIQNRGSGRSARELADKHWLKAVKNLLIALGIILFILMLVAGASTSLGIGGMFFLLVIAKIIDRQLGKEITWHRKRERQAIRGAEAEDDIADVLNQLSDDYRVFNDVPAKVGDIDHVVISRSGGVFLIETKSHRGKVTFGDNELFINERPPEKNFLGRILTNTYWLRDEIREQTGQEVWVNAVLVFSNAFVDFHRPIRGVQVLNKKFLIEHIERNRPKRNLPEIWAKVRL
jgi:hypothetical protein